MAWDNGNIAFSIIMVLTALLYSVMSYNGYAQLSQNTLESIVNETSMLTSAQINVGLLSVGVESYKPSPIESGAIYVTNSGSDTVSVIEPDTNTVIKKIPVGDRPGFIYSFEDTIYVANSGNASVSLIDANTNTVIKNITTVGIDPSFIESSGNTIYVANSGSDTVSVINTTSNMVVENITVGKYPIYISTFPDSQDTDAIYVANYNSGTMSVIDPSTKAVVAGVTFDIKPLRGGQIICNGLKSPISRFLYVTSGTGCSAEPNSGFEFTSWTQSMPDNTTIVINASTPSGSPWTSFLKIFDIKSNDPSSNLTINRFGKFTAYFNEAPPPIPDGIWIALFSILLGTFMPSIIRWINGWKQRRTFARYNKELPSKYENMSREVIYDEITELYVKGKINETQQKIIKDNIVEHYDRNS